MLPIEQSELEQARCIETVDPEHRAGSCSSRGGWHQPDELRAGHLDASRRRLRFDAGDDLVQRRGLVVLDVHADLRVTGARQREAERANTPEAAVLLADHGRDRARDLHVVGSQVDVERDQRPPRADDHAARAWVEPCGAEIRRQLPGVDAPLQLTATTAAEQGGPTAGRQLAVQEDRQLELRADAFPHFTCDCARAIAFACLERDDRDDVGRADPRMRALVPTQVDSLARARDAGEQRSDELPVIADDGENRPVVIGVGMHVEDVSMGRECRTQRLDRVGIAPFGEVRHRFERQAHRRTLGAVKAYYAARAREYDDWWLGRGLYADQERPGWREELQVLERVLSELPPKRTLDVACGTGFLTRHLRGEVVGVDASAQMLAIARQQAPGAQFIQGDALSLPFADQSFERVFTSYFYCHLEEEERRHFLAEARRIAPQLVVVGSRLKPGTEPRRWEERRLKDGSVWTVYKRVFVGSELAAELGGGDVLHEGYWFVVVRA